MGSAASIKAETMTVVASSTREPLPVKRKRRKASVASDGVAKRQCGSLSYRPLDAVVLPLPSQHHSTGLASPERYETRHEIASMVQFRSRRDFLSRPSPLHWRRHPSGVRAG